MRVSAITRWGTGCGIEIRGDDLVVVAAKSRHGGVRVVGRALIASFRERSPQEWGAEYAAFLSEHGLGHLAATVCLPRRDVTVRLIQLPAMGSKEMAAAVDLQVDALHPFGDEEVYHAYAPLSRAQSAEGRVSVAVVIAEAALIDDYAAMFAAAGVATASFSVAAAAFNTALRLRWDQPPRPFVIADSDGPRLELYGESDSREVWTSEFDLASVPAQRAMQFAYSDLRLDPERPAALVVCGAQDNGLDETPVSADSEAPASAGFETQAFHGFETRAVEELLPTPAEAPPEFELRRDAAAFAVALESACPRIGWSANLLPAVRRQSDSRLMFAPTAALLVLLGLLGLGFIARPLMQNTAYAGRIEAETERLNRIVLEVETARKNTGDARVRLEQIQRLQARTETDLRILSELSSRLPDSAWLRSLDLGDEGVQVAGVAAEAASLLGIINESSTVHEARFTRSLAIVEEGERFQIDAKRRPLELPAVEALLRSAQAAPAPEAVAEAPAPVHDAAPAEASPETLSPLGSEQGGAQ